MRTFEEDMSDLAGIQAAFKAYKKQANETTEMTNLLRLYELPDFSTDMLFFLSFAQVSKIVVLHNICIIF